MALRWSDTHQHYKYGLLVQIYTIYIQLLRRFKTIKQRIRKNSEIIRIRKKNSAYGRQSISRPMRLVAPMPQEGGPRQNKQIQQQKNCAAILDHFQTKMFKCQTTSFHYFSQGFRISKNIGHPTLGSGGKKTVKSAFGINFGLWEVVKLKYTITRICACSFF